MTERNNLCEGELHPESVDGQSATDDCPEWRKKSDTSSGVALGQTRPRSLPKSVRYKLSRVVGVRGTGAGTVLKFLYCQFSWGCADKKVIDPRHNKRG